MEELFDYIFGIYKKFVGNNPSILTQLDSRSALEKRFILILIQFLEIFLKFFEEEVSDYLS